MEAETTYHNVDISLGKTECFLPVKIHWLREQIATDLEFNDNLILTYGFICNTGFDFDDYKQRQICKCNDKLSLNKKIAEIHALWHGKTFVGCHAYLTNPRNIVNDRVVRIRSNTPIVVNGTSSIKSFDEARNAAIDEFYGRL